MTSGHRSKKKKTIGTAGLGKILPFNKPESFWHPVFLTPSASERLREGNGPTEEVAKSARPAMALADARRSKANRGIHVSF